MPASSEKIIARRTKNAPALAAFGIKSASKTFDERYQTVTEGKGPSVFTIGYERRTGEDLIDTLKDAGVDLLVDVRQRAMSRKADFRGKALAALCEESGIDYCPMPSLGSTDDLRNALRETGDIKQFMKRFHSLAKRTMTEALDELGKVAQKNTIALLCYERCHGECHRSVVAEMLHQKLDANIVAL